MSLIKLIIEIIKLGVRIEINGNAIRLRGTAERLPLHLKEEVRKNKEAIIVALRNEKELFDQLHQDFYLSEVKSTIGTDDEYPWL